MKCLFLIYLDEKEIDAMPASDRNALNAKHLDLNGRRAARPLIEEGRQP